MVENPMGVALRSARPVRHPVDLHKGYRPRQGRKLGIEQYRQHRRFAPLTRPDRAEAKSTGWRTARLSWMETHKGQEAEGAHLGQMTPGKDAEQRQAITAKSGLAPHVHCKDDLRAVAELFAFVAANPAESSAMLGTGRGSRSPRRMPRAGSGRSPASHTRGSSTTSTTSTTTPWR